MKEIIGFICPECFKIQEDVRLWYEELAVQYPQIRENTIDYGKPEIKEVFESGVQFLECGHEAYEDIENLVVYADYKNKTLSSPFFEELLDEEKERVLRVNSMQDWKIL